MSGHSKWSTIKRQKGVADARRGQLFTRLGREVTMAAREGGGSTEGNFRLRLAVQRCRDNNMPMENIERAIKRGTGEGGSNALVETSFEGYGPHGIAILVEALTDNRNRVLQEMRNVFDRAGGRLAEAGSVSWIFEPKGIITIESGNFDAEEMALYAIDAGAEDVKVEEGSIEVQTAPDKLEIVRHALEQRQIPMASTELSMTPKTTVQLKEKEAIQALKLLDKLEEMDDVQKVFSNVDLTDDVLEKLKAQS